MTIFLLCVRYRSGHPVVAPLRRPTLSIRITHRPITSAPAADCDLPPPLAHVKSNRPGNRCEQVQQVRTWLGDELRRKLNTVDPRIAEKALRLERRSKPQVHRLTVSVKGGAPARCGAMDQVADEGRGFHRLGSKSRTWLVVIEGRRLSTSVKYSCGLSARRRQLWMMV